MLHIEELLELIDTIDHNDINKMKELNRVFWISYTGCDSLCDFQHTEKAYKDIWNISGSRDALKSIRPKGYWIEIRQDHRTWFCQLHKTNQSYAPASNKKTEELAELHAIIQAIAWERQNGTN